MDELRLELPARADSTILDVRALSVKNRNECLTGSRVVLLVVIPFLLFHGSWRLGDLLFLFFLFLLLLLLPLAGELFLFHGLQGPLLFARPPPHRGRDDAASFAPARLGSPARRRWWPLVCIRGVLVILLVLVFVVLVVETGGPLLVVVAVGVGCACAVLLLVLRELREFRV
jgi:hypothetical protein